MMHHPHSPVDRYQQRPTSQSPHIQHQQLDPSLGPGGQGGGYDDPQMMQMQQQGHPQQGGYMQQQQQGQPVYDEDYMRR
jgi:hypothetical protein